MTMLFNAPCKTGHLRVDARSVKVVSGKRILWTTARSKITYIAVKQGVLHADLTIYTATNQFPAHSMTNQHVRQFLAFFPSVPHGEPPVVAPPPVYAPPPMAPGAQWNAAPTVPFHVPPPPTKKKPPVWAYVVVIILVIGLCGGISSAVVNAVSGNTSQQAQIAPTPTDTPSDTGQSSTLAATVSADAPTSVPTTAPVVAPTSKPTPRPTSKPIPTQPPAPKPTPTPCASPCNPFGYSFSPGSLIYSPNASFCSYFSCISNFWNGHGFVNECQDGSYSKSGGIRGDCSSHGGELRPLYSH